MMMMMMMMMMLIAIQVVVINDVMSVNGGCGGLLVRTSDHRSNQLSLLSGYPEPAATQIRNRGLRPARHGYKFKKKKKKNLI